MKAVLITNVITRAIFIICVTILAISFDKISILWWFVLLPFLGYEYKETPITHSTEKGGEQK